MNALLHYEAIAEFRHQFLKDLLTHEHLSEGQIYIDKVAFTDKTTDDEFNFWGYRFDKDGTKYLLPCANNAGKEIDLKETLPIKVKAAQKVAYRGDVFHLILDYSSAKPRAQQTMSFKELVDKFAGLKHENPEHQKLLWFMGFAQMYGRCNFRVCTPAGFGKDSVVATLGNMIGGCAAVVKPSPAKIAFRAAIYKWFAVNEVTRVPKADWENIEPTILDIGAMLPTVEKSTRAFGKVGETIDIRKLSLSLLYNDIDHISDRETFIDFKAHKALLDRFPAFRLWGRYQEDFNAIKQTNIPKFVTENFEEYKKMVYAFAFYEKHYLEMQHGWNRSLLRSDISERWKTNLGVLLHIVDLYSASQAEFDAWLSCINDAMTDYDYMLQFDEAREKVQKRVTLKEYRELGERLKKSPTYKSKVEMLRAVLDGGNTTYRDGAGLW